MAIYDAYEQYYRSRLYDDRYPRPNRRTLGLVLAAAPRGSTLVDIGAGNGRYALPLARIGYRVLAVERSETARAQLHERLAGSRLEGAVEVFPDLASVPAPALTEASMAMLLFGVLGHMNYAERADVIGALSEAMSPTAGLLGSVPNRFRRFRREQREGRIADGGRPPRFEYRRPSEAGELTLEYTAYSPSELRAELADFGWHCRVLSPESLLPEAAVTSRPRVGALDAAASAVLPAAAGYCILYQALKGGPRTKFGDRARPEPEPERTTVRS